jgi:hypothetical protein
MGTCLALAEFKVGLRALPEASFDSIDLGLPATICDSRASSGFGEVQCRFEQATGLGLVSLDPMRVPYEGSHLRGDTGQYLLVTGVQSDNLIPGLFIRV